MDSLNIADARHKRCVTFGSVCVLLEGRQNESRLSEVRLVILLVGWDPRDPLCAGDICYLVGCWLSECVQT